jgi:outer membrane protein TolC
MVEAARTRHDLARKEYKPDMNLGVAYGFRDGTNANGIERPDFATVRLSFNLPIYPGVKQDKAVAQRAHEINESDLALQEARQQVMAEIGEAYANYRQARSQAELFKTGIIPQASQTVASMLSAYQVNKVDFLNLVRSQLTLYDYEIQYWQALSLANRALATLTAAVGKEEIYE